VLRALELVEYRCLPVHQPGCLAAPLGVSPQLEQSSLEVLERSGQIRFDGRRYEPTRIQAVDTRADPARARELRAGWAAVGVERLRAGAPGVLSYSLGTVSREALQRLEALQRAYYRDMVSVIAESEPAECVVLYSAQLLELRGS
jgi:hypothetical protein